MKKITEDQNDILDLMIFIGYAFLINGLCVKKITFGSMVAYIYECHRCPGLLMLTMNFVMTTALSHPLKPVVGNRRINGISSFSPPRPQLPGTRCSYLTRPLRTSGSADAVPGFSHTF